MGSFCEGRGHVWRSSARRRDEGLKVSVLSVMPIWTLARGVEGSGTSLGPLAMPLGVDV